MRKVLLKSLPYLLLIILYLSVGEYFLFRIKENIPITYIVDKQVNSKQEFYYGRSLFEDALPIYKYKSLESRKPSVVALGQSIIFNFRDFFFHPYESTFYNTGLMVKNIYDLEFFKEQIENKIITKPDFMVIGVDYSFILKNNGLDKKEELKNLVEDPVYNYKEHLRAIQEVYLKKDVREVPSVCLGLGKKGMGGNGYRKDGSFSYKWELENFLKDSLHMEGPSKEKLIAKTHHYKLPMEKDMKKWNKLVQVLKEYRDLGIEVVLYFPPASDEFHQFAMKDPDFSKFWNQYMQLQRELEIQGFDMIKFTTPSQIGLNDYYMNNADHPGDILVAKQFYSYCKSEERKNKFVEKIDTAYLHKMINEAPNPLSFMLDTLVYGSRMSK